MAKAHKNLYSQVHDWENLWLALCRARRGKRAKQDVCRFEFNAEEELLRLRSLRQAALLLQNLNMAVVMADHPWYPRMQHVTSDFSYLRLLGKRDLFPDYSQTYQCRDNDLKEWANVLRSQRGISQKHSLHQRSV